MLKGIDFIFIGDFNTNLEEHFDLSFIHISSGYSKNFVYNAVRDIFVKYNQRHLGYYVPR